MLVYIVVTTDSNNLLAQFVSGVYSTEAKANEQIRTLKKLDKALGLNSNYFIHVEVLDDESE